MSLDFEKTIFILLVIFSSSGCSIMKQFVVVVCVLGAVLSLPADYNFSDDDRAEELENAFQGDMIISQQDLVAFNGRIDERLRWANNIVPYYINMQYFSELE